MEYGAEKKINGVNIVDYQMEYKGLKGDKFTWLFIDYHTLADCAKKAGLQIELLVEGETDNYLARLF